MPEAEIVRVEAPDSAPKGQRVEIRIYVRNETEERRRFFVRVRELPDGVERGVYNYNGVIKPRRGSCIRY